MIQHRAKEALSSWGKDGYRSDIGHYVRSRWEANVCRVLIRLGIQYSYEPETFRIGAVAYTPDLRIGTGYIEIKGYSTAKCIRKLEAFRQRFPDTSLHVIGPKEYEAMEREWSDRILEWEFLHEPRV